MRTEDKLLNAIQTYRLATEKAADSNRLIREAEDQGRVIMVEARARRESVLQAATDAVEKLDEAADNAEETLIRAIKAAGWADKDLYDPERRETLRYDSKEDQLVVTKHELIVLTPDKPSRKLSA